MTTGDLVARLTARANLTYSYPIEDILLLRGAANEIERLRAALRRILELDVPRPVGRAWRQDGAPSRHDACPHDLRMYEDCYACIAEYAGAVLEGKETK